MIEEMPVVKAAAKQFAQAVLRPQDRIALVGFNQRLFWLTGFTNDFNAVAAAVDRVKPGGETHLYDFAIEMLYELQKQPADFQQLVQEAQPYHRVSGQIKSQFDADSRHPLAACSKKARFKAGVERLKIAGRQRLRVRKLLPQRLDQFGSQ